MLMEEDKARVDAEKALVDHLNCSHLTVGSGADVN